MMILLGRVVTLSFSFILNLFVLKYHDLSHIEGSRQSIYMIG